MMKKNVFYAISLLIVISAISCKKNDDDSTKPSLTGLEIICDYDNYMGEGREILMQADISNLTLSSNTISMPEKIGIYYVFDSVRDTITTDAKAFNPAFTINVGEAGNYSVYVYAFGGDKCYNASAAISFTVVNPETALEGLPQLPTEEIGGNKFSTIVLGGKTWMANNLYGTDAGTDFQDSEILTTIFGKYYTWTEAQKSCPEGWHLPSASEFDNCLGSRAGDLMVNATFVNNTMWSYWPQVQITNKTQFCAIPVGYRDFTNEDTPEKGFKKYACFWTSDQQEDCGVFRSIYEESADIQKSQGDKNTLAMSVRCIKD